MPQTALAGAPPYPVVATPCPLNPTAARATDPESPFSSIGFRFLLFFVFLSTSRVMDYLGPELHLPLVLSIVATAATVLNQGVQRAFQSPIGKMMGLFALWFVICIPFSQWRGGSFYTLTDQFSKSFLLFVMVAGMATTVQRVRKMMVTMFLGTAVLMIIALALQSRVVGRLNLPYGQFGNPNDLAQVLVLGMCFMPAWSIQKNPNAVLKALMYCLMLPFLYAVFDTGSRAVLLTAVLLAVLVFLTAAAGKKALLLILFTVLGMGLLTTSGTARDRLMTLFSSNAVEVDERAATSTQSRMASLQDSLLLTMQNPLFGVGPGIFSAAAADLAGAEGKRALWVETHNAYTQVSSETGIPGFLMFGGAVLYSILALIRIRKRARSRPEHQTIYQLASYLLMGFLSFAVSSMFSSVAYQFLFSMLIGLCAAGVVAMKKELQTPALQPAVMPLPVPRISRAMPGPSSPPPEREPRPTRKHHFASSKALRWASPHPRDRTIRE